MTGLVCGLCARKSGMSLDERISLSKMFKVHTVYQCHDCKLYLYFDSLRWFKTFDFFVIQGFADFHLKEEGVYCE
jgi:hypothetical protein